MAVGNHPPLPLAIEPVFIDTACRTGVVFENGFEGDELRGKVPGNVYLMTAVDNLFLRLLDRLATAPDVVENNREAGIAHPPCDAPEGDIKQPIRRGQPNPALVILLQAIDYLTAHALAIAEMLNGSLLWRIAKETKVGDNPIAALGIL